MGRPKKDRQKEQKELITTAHTAICKLICSLNYEDPRHYDIKPLAEEIEELCQQITRLQNKTNNE